MAKSLRSKVKQRYRRAKRHFIDGRDSYQLILNTAGFCHVAAVNETFETDCMVSCNCMFCIFCSCSVYF